MYLYVNVNLNSNHYILLNQFAAKNLERSSKKCEKEEKAEKVKLKKVYKFVKRKILNNLLVKYYFQFINNITGINNYFTKDLFC